MGELGAGTFARILGSVEKDAMERGRTLILKFALATETQAKKNASNGSHKYGTPTPARPNEGPAVVSGTLRRSITHTTPVFTSLSWTIKVGMAGGVYPPYGKRPTASSRYAYYLETGKLRNGAAYPFLGPAARMACENIGALSKQVFGAPWSKSE